MLSIVINGLLIKSPKCLGLSTNVKFSVSLISSSSLIPVAKLVFKLFILNIVSNATSLSAKVKLSIILNGKYAFTL